MVDHFGSSQSHSLQNKEMRRMILALEELSGLQDGWLDGKGIAPSPEGLDWLANAFDTRYPEDLSLPSVYPTAEGGIRAEWSVKRYEVSLEIDLSKKTGEWHQLNLDTDDEDTSSLNLETDEGWKWLACRVRSSQGAACLHSGGEE